jgi:peroxiredoxin
METNNEGNLKGWVDERLHLLDVDDHWQPDSIQALRRFHELSSKGRRARRRVAMAAVGTTACLLVLWMSRALAPQFGQNSHPLINVGQVSAAPITLKRGQEAPDFNLQSDSGNRIRLAAFTGRVVVLNFWATWCHGCRTEIPWLIEFQKKYRARGLMVIGVSMDDEGWKVVRPFIAEKNVNYPIAIGNDDMAKSYGLSSMPMTFLIDRNGKVAATSIGVVDQDACEREIVQLLSQ